MNCEYIYAVTITNCHTYEVHIDSYFKHYDNALIHASDLRAFYHDALILCEVKRIELMDSDFDIMEDY